MRRLRVAFLVLVVTVLVVEGWLLAPHVRDWMMLLGNVRWPWVVACIVAAAVSMSSFAQVQRTLLRSAGVKVAQWKSESVVYTSNAISVTMPGGQVLAPLFTYRQTRKWGASPVVASWQVAMSGLMMGAGLALLGLTGALMTGAKTSPFSVIFSLGGFVVFLVLAQYVASRPEILRNIGARVLVRVNGIRGKDPDHGLSRWDEILEQLRAVQLSRRDAVRAFLWCLVNWVSDVVCLAFACYSVNAHPGFAALAVAYASGKAAGTLFPAPANLLASLGVLVPALAFTGMSGSQSISSVIVYLGVSFMLVAAVGWILFFAMYRDALQRTKEDDLTTTDAAPGSEIAGTP